MDCNQCTSNCYQPSFLQQLFGRSPRPPFERLDAEKRIALVGTPNVGKSVLFNALTQSYVTVSNYPGTTVEVSKGEMKVNDWSLTIIDTPGMYSLVPITEEEQVTRELLLTTNLDLVLHVMDAKNLGRMLPMTLQLIEAGFPLLLVINMMDEAERFGLQIHPHVLEERLGIPVVLTTASRHQGIHELTQKVAHYVTALHVSSPY